MQQSVSSTPRIEATLGAEACSYERPRRGRGRSTVGDSQGDRGSSYRHRYQHHQAESHAVLSAQRVTILTHQACYQSDLSCLHGLRSICLLRCPRTGASIGSIS